MKRNYQIVFSIILPIILLILGLIRINSFVIEQFPKEKEFLPTWSSLRTYLDYGIDPYDENATNRTELLYYKQLVNDDKDPLILDQPLNSTLFFIPLAIINDYSIARIVYLLGLEFFLIIIPLSFVYIQGWKPGWLVLAIFILLAFISPFQIQALFTHDPAIFTIGLILLGLLSLKYKLDEFAGALISLTIYQPSLSGILIIFLILWVLRSKRWRILWGFLLTISLLTAISVALIPDWIISFVKAYRIESVYKNYLSSQVVLSELIPGVTNKITIFLTGIFSLVLLYEWIVMKKGDYRWLIWTISLTISMYPFLGIPFQINYSIMFFIPFAYLFIEISNKFKGKSKELIQLMILAIFFLSSWGFYLYFTNQQTQRPMNLGLFVIIPLILTSGLYWMRWWVVKYSNLQVEM